MGFLRTFLALSVFYWHMATPTEHFFLNGAVAVASFYIISGYLMASTFAANYSDGQRGLRAFLLNRALRIYPIYFVVLLLTVFFHSASGQGDPFIGYSPSSAFAPGPLLHTALILANTSIFGIDIFALLDKTHIITLPNNARLLNPSWSIASELLFYLTVPFCARSSIQRLALMMLAAALFRWAMQSPGPWPYDVDPWTYYLAPSTYVFFLLGAISFRICRPINGAFPSSVLTAIALTCLVLSMVYAAVDQYVSPDRFECWIYYVLLAISCTILTKSRSSSRLEANVGQLSYPIYLFHPLFIDVYDFYIGTHATEFVRYTSLTLLVVVSSILAYWTIERPVDLVRTKIRRRPVALVSVQRDATLKRKVA